MRTLRIAPPKKTGRKRNSPLSLHRYLPGRKIQIRAQLVSSSAFSGKHSGRALRNALCRLKALRRLRLTLAFMLWELSVLGRRCRAVLEAGAGVPVTEVAESVRGEPP